MGIGAFFILLIALGVLVVLGGGFYVLTMWLRHRQLHPEGDKAEGPRAREPGGGRADAESEQGDERSAARPAHVRVENEQRTRFIGSR